MQPVRRGNGGHESTRAIRANGLVGQVPLYICGGLNVESSTAGFAQYMPRHCSLGRQM